MNVCLILQISSWAFVMYIKCDNPAAAIVSFQLWWKKRLYFYYEKSRPVTLTEFHILMQIVFDKVIFLEKKILWLPWTVLLCSVQSAQLRRLVSHKALTSSFTCGFILLMSIKDNLIIISFVITHNIKLINWICFGLTIEMTTLKIIFLKLHSSVIYNLRILKNLLQRFNIYWIKCGLLTVHADVCSS